MAVKAVFAIEGMECPSCAMRLEGMEDTLDGVRSVEASYLKGQMVVEYDEKKIGEPQIAVEVSRLGYRVTGVSRK